MASANNVTRQRTSSDQYSETNRHPASGKATESKIPGQKCKHQLFYFHLANDVPDPAMDDNQTYNDVGGTVDVYDPFFCNCTIQNEINQVAYNHERRRYEYVGSHGLVRRLIAFGDIEGFESGQAKLADAPGTEEVLVSIENPTADELSDGTMFDALFVPSTGDDTYDSMDLENAPPKPTRPRDGKWFPLSTITGAGHFVVKTEGEIAPATENEGGTFTPTAATGVARWIFNMSGDLVAAGQNLTIYNIHDQEIPAGLHVVESIDGKLIVDPKGEGETTYWCDLDDIISAPAEDGTPSIAPSQTIMRWNPNTLMMESFADSQDVRNLVTNMAFKGRVPVLRAGDYWIIVGFRQRGDLICKLKSDTNVMIPNNGSSTCTVTEQLGPDFSYFIANETTVHNPRNLVGWDNLICRWNWINNRYEVIQTNLKQGGLWPVELNVTSATQGNTGTKDAPPDFNYDVRGFGSIDNSREFANDVTITNGHPHFARRTIGTYSAATHGSIFYDGATFLIYEAIETPCVTEDLPSVGMQP